MKLIPALLMATMAVSGASASTWPDEGTVVAMDRGLAKELAQADLCSGVPDDETLAVYDSGNTIFVLDKSGSITALKDMFAERFWLDYCQ